MSRIKLAIDGCGQLCLHTILPHLAQPDARQQLQVVAVCDIVADRARAAAEQFGIPAWFDDYESLLAASDADAVLIVVPSPLHFAHALLAVRSGRHVYVQKPLTSTVAEADQLLAEVLARGLTLVAAPGQALWPLYDRLRELVQAGAIGQPYLALAPLLGWGGRQLNYPADPRWFFAPGSGPLRDHGGYGIQTLTSVLGPVRRVVALADIGVPERVWSGQTLPVTEPDNTTVLLDFACGAHGVLPEAWCASSPAGASLRLHGLEGSIEGWSKWAGFPGVFPLGCWLHRPGRDPEPVRVEPTELSFLADEHVRLPNPHVYADILHLVECIADGRIPRAGGAQARHTVDIIETALLAAEQGRTLPLSTDGAGWWPL